MLCGALKLETAKFSETLVTYHHNPEDMDLEVEGSRHGLFQGTIPAFAWRN
jgi:hypothetical protein